MIAFALAQEEVVVQAPERSLEAETSATVTVVEVDERLPDGLDLAGAVGSVPGVALRRLGGIADVSTVSIRGSTERQVEVFLDGVPLNPDGVGVVDLSEYPLHTFSRIEVYRGNAPVGMGGTAIGGAVNLVTGTEPATGFSGLLGTQSTARIQGLLRRDLPVGDVFFTARALSTSGRFRYFVENAPAVVEDDTWALRENNDARQGNLMARVRLGTGRVRFTAFEVLNGREEGIPGFTADPLENVRLQTVQSLSVAELEGRGKVPVKARISLQQRTETLRDPLDELALAQGVPSRLWSLGGQVLGGFSGAPWWRLSWAGSLRHELVVGRGQRQVGRIELGGWLRLGPLRLQPAVSAFGLRSEGVGEALGLQVLPRLGAVIQLGDAWQLKSNAGRTVRAPDLLELFGNRGPLVGRPDLRAERAWFVDLGLRAQGRWGVMELGGFVRETVDLITYVQNAQGAAVPANLGRTGIQGLEAALQITGIPWLDWQTNGTLQHSVNRSDDPVYAGRRLPRQPAVQVDQRLGLVWGPGRLIYGLSFTDGVYTDPQNQRRQAVRLLHSLSGRVDLAKGLQVTVDVQNLLDTKTQRVLLNPLDPEGPKGPRAVADYVGYPLPGRTVLLGVRYTAP